MLLTYFLFLPALTGLLFHIPMARKFIREGKITDKNEFMQIQWKRVFIVASLYLIFIAISVYTLGTGPLHSTLINCAICIGAGYKKITGKDPLVQKSFLEANKKYIK